MISCLHPVNLSNAIVPCGHCILCANREKRQWIVRCILEKRFHQDNCFVTLTFDDEHLDDFGHRKIELFFKRLRKAEQAKFRYFGCFERGEQNFRPHFHILFFGWSPIADVVNYKILHSQEQKIAEIWQNGLVDIKPLESAGISYVCNYVQKKNMEVKKPAQMLWKDWRLFNKWSVNDFGLYSNFDAYFKNKNLKVDLDESVCVKQTYFFMSKGLGFDWFKDDNRNQNKIVNNEIILDGSNRITPKAFRDKLKRDIDGIEFPETIENTEEYERLTDAEKILFQDIIKEHNQVKANDLQFFEK